MIIIYILCLLTLTQNKVSDLDILTTTDYEEINFYVVKEKFFLIKENILFCYILKETLFTIPIVRTTKEQRRFEK